MLKKKKSNAHYKMPFNSGSQHVKETLSIKGFPKWEMNRMIEGVFRNQAMKTTVRVFLTGVKWNGRSCQSLSILKFYEDSRRDEANTHKTLFNWLLLFPKLKRINFNKLQGNITDFSHPISSCFEWTRKNMANKVIPISTFHAWEEIYAKQQSKYAWQGGNYYVPSWKSVLNWTGNSDNTLEASKKQTH